MEIEIETDIKSFLNSIRCQVFVLNRLEENKHVPIFKPPSSSPQKCKKHVGWRFLREEGSPDKCGKKKGEVLSPQKEN